MKITKLFLGAALFSGLLSVSSFATVMGNSARAQRSDLQLPVLIKVVPPQVQEMFEHASVRLAFTLDETGVPHHIRAVDLESKELMSRLIPAVEQWRFTPASKDGKPVEIQVMLPITLVAKS